MGKKNDTVSAPPATADIPAPAPLPTLKAPAIPSAANGDGKPAKKKTAAAAPKAAKPAATKAAPKRAVAVKASKPASRAKKVTFTVEEISLRAYFIHEHRHKHGIHGDEHSDWVEAERQLHAEHKKKTARKKS